MNAAAARLHRASTDTRRCCALVCCGLRLLLQLYGYAKAVLTGEPHKGELQEHKKINMP